jgi:hypothetical protein
LQGFLTPESAWYRMVEPIVRPTFGPRVGHETLSSWTTARPTRGASRHLHAEATPIDLLFTMRSDRQSVAIGGNGFGLSEPFSAPTHLPLIASGCDRSAPKCSTRRRL